MAPIVHGLEAEFFGKINFVYLDIDDPANDELKRELGYRVQPHIFLLDGDGNVIQQWIGIVSEDVLRTALEETISE
jgi:hypothetical protein